MTQGDLTTVGQETQEGLNERQEAAVRQVTETLVDKRHWCNKRRRDNQQDERHGRGNDTVQTKKRLITITRIPSS